MIGRAALFGMFVGAMALTAYPQYPHAQQAPSAHPAAAVRAGKGERVCRVRLKYTGELRTWVCKKDEP